MSYTVRSGDTLTKIAKNFQTTVKKLVEANQIKNRNKIFVGQTLFVPTSESSKIQVGDQVVVVRPIEFGTGRPLNVYGVYDVIQVTADRAVIGRGGAITSAISIFDIQKV